MLFDVVSGEHIIEIVGDLPVDLWGSLSGGVVSAVGGEALLASRRSGGGSSSGGGGSSSPSGSDSGRLEGAAYAWALYHWFGPIWASRVSKFYEISAGARFVAREVYLGDQGRVNALRHGLWQAGLTYEFGAEMAEELGDIHEEGEDETRPVDSWIDQYNNQQARNIAQAKLDSGASLEEAQSCIAEAVEDGTLIIDTNDPRVPLEVRQAQEEIDNQ